MNWWLILYFFLVIKFLVKITIDLPFSRYQKCEADYIGMSIAAKAQSIGFVKVFSRMKKETEKNTKRKEEKSSFQNF